MINFNSKNKLNSIVKFLIYFMVASTSFHLSYLGVTVFFPIYFFALWQLTKIKSIAIAFFIGLLLSYSIYVYHLEFFIRIFKSFSFTLFTVLALWLALFLSLSVWFRKCYSVKLCSFLIPCLYLVLEFIRCELYPLKFSWVIPGWSFAESATYSGIGFFGVYGISFFTLLFISCGQAFIRNQNLQYTGLLILSILYQIPQFITPFSQDFRQGPRVTGIQWEMASRKELLQSLNKAQTQHPDTDIFFLSEYSFDEGIPEKIREWCKKHKVYLLAGTTETIKDSSVIKNIKKNIGGKTKQKPYFNMAMVVGPEGKIVFKQAKVMPIQFFTDGVPALEQKVWHSPWGKLGIATCYDLSYSKVTDELIRQGAQALLIPTMDVEHWGLRQRNLHGRIAPTRAVEYRMPIYRVCSSGISQFVDKNGRIQASGSYPGQGDILSAQLELNKKGARPLDRFLIYPLIVFMASVIPLSVLVQIKRAHPKARP